MHGGTFCILTPRSYCSILFIYFFPDCFVDIRMWDIASRYLINCIGFFLKKKVDLINFLFNFFMLRK